MVPSCGLAAVRVVREGRRSCERMKDWGEKGEQRAHRAHHRASFLGALSHRRGRRGHRGPGGVGLERYRQRRRGFDPSLRLCWPHGAPDQPTFEPLMCEAVREIDTWIAWLPSLYRHKPTKAHNNKKVKVVLH